MPTMRAETGLLLGTISGVALVVASSLIQFNEGAESPENALASVNGQVIAKEQFIRAVEMVNAERRSPLNAAEREQVLERLISEELLYQYAMQLDLPRRHPRLRNSVIQEVMATVRDAADTQLPSRAALEDFYQSNPGLFQTADRVRGAVIYVSAEPLRSPAAALDRAQQAALNLRSGQPAAEVIDQYHEGGFRLPDTALPPDKLRDYLGASLTETLMALPAGDVSEPVVGERGVYVLQSLSVERGELPPFDQVESAVRDALLRRQAERRLSDLLADLRDNADIRIHE